jgi:hypothetical protein
MTRVARVVHLLGLVLFLGSILAFAVASSVPGAGDLADLAVARRVISAGTAFLTLPGLTLLVASGTALLVTTSRAWGEPWARVMALAAAAVVANTVLIVAPAVRSATALAEAAVVSGSLGPGYPQAYMTESVAGGINIVLTLVAMTAGVWRCGARQTH